MRTLRMAIYCVGLIVAMASGAGAEERHPQAPVGQWVVVSINDGRTSLPNHRPDNAKPITPGDKWKEDRKFRWLVGDLVIPETIDGKPVNGRPVALHINCGDSGEIWFDGKIQTRYDHDHPGLVVVAEKARPGTKVRVAIQVYGRVSGDDDGQFGEARWALMEHSRTSGRLKLALNTTVNAGPVPDGLIGLSQGGGMSDYEEATAKKLREGGFKWFRMDNVLTGTVKKAADGTLAYDWADLDKRLDFVHAIGAKFMIAASYMPQVFDAVPNGERQSAPASYPAWEELCYRAASRAIERGKRVPFWEVWNEVNAGWLKPGPQDTGSEAFAQLYDQAIGKPEGDHEVVRRFEAYCKLYAATARGVRRADPTAQIGGPALASGPFESSPGVHGRGFARGLIAYCAQEKLPLDFLSWHEYFQAADIIASEAREMREDVKAYPQFHDAADRLAITEWNEAWWPTHAHDNELGAAWCANSVTRSFIPERVAHPCLFYAKQGDGSFRGDYGILMAGNVPKASFNMAKVFNSLHGQWVPVNGGDDEVSAVAAWDTEHSRLSIVLVNFRWSDTIQRLVRISGSSLPREVQHGRWKRWTIDATHSNVWNDAAHAQLEQTGEGITRGNLDETLAPNSITLIEVAAKD